MMLPPASRRALSLEILTVEAQVCSYRRFQKNMINTKLNASRLGQNNVVDWES